MRKFSSFLIVLLIVTLHLSTASKLRAETVDIMIVYDTTSTTWVANNGGMTLFSADVVSRMNQAMSNSGINLTFNLVHQMSVAYTTTSTSSTPLNEDLYALQEGANAFAPVHTARDTYGADLVTMLVDHGSAYGYVGVGYTMWDWAGIPNYAFSVCAIQSVAISHTLTHEVGHNFGAHHSKFQSQSPGPNTNLDNQYSAGWYFTGTNGTAYHTIMAYNYDGTNNYVSVPLFSTPLLAYQGTTAGDAADGDNSRLLRQTMATTAGYRASSCSYSISPTNGSFGAGGGTENVSVTASSSSCTWDTSESLTWVSLSPTAGTGSGTVTMTVSANTGGVRNGTVLIAGQLYSISQEANASSGDSYEPDDTSAEASNIVFNNTQSHSIDPANDIDWVRFTLSTPMNIVLTTSGVSGDTRMWLYDSELAELEYNDDNGLNSFSTIQTNLGIGTYFVRIDENGNNAVLSSYTLSLTGTSSCSYSISPINTTYTSTGGSQVVTVTTVPGCAWSASENLTWVNLSQANGTGIGTVTVTASSNSGAARSGTATIAGQTFSFNQLAAPCTYSISPTSNSFVSSGGSETVSVSVSRSDCSWTTSESISWLNLLPASGSGSGTLTVTVTANTGAARSGTATIAGQTYSATQTAAAATGDGFEPDNASGDASSIELNETQSRSIAPVSDIDWVQFSVSKTTDIVIETSGISGDTKVWLYDNNLAELAFDDDGGSNYFSLITKTELSTGTYYIKVEEYGNNDIISTYSLSLSGSSPNRPSIISIIQLLLLSNKQNQLPFFTDFDQLDINESQTIIPFKSEGQSYLSWSNKLAEFSNSVVDSNAHSGSCSINLIPNGNPSTTENGILSSVRLNRIFDVSRYSSVYVSVSVHSTSNPRLSSVHNCDSNVDIIYRLDGKDWQHYMALCGQHKDENAGWWNVILSSQPFSTEGADTVEFALEYYIQNSNGDTSVHYLIDDFSIIGVK